MKTQLKFLIIITALGLTLFSCTWNNWATVHPVVATPPCKVVDTSTAISYSVDIAPIVASKCAIGGCHSAGSTTTARDYSFYGNTRTGIASVCGGGLSGSSAWQDITGASGNPMPKSGNPQLTPCETNTIRNWILHGARQN